jgi:hypothetical protein
MPRVTLMQTNFTAGEVSPRLLGRVDIARYANGARLIENAYPMVHGGVSRRPGSRFVAAAKYPEKRVRLIPYVFNKEQAYMLEFGDLYLRVYKDGAQVLNEANQPYEIATPYTADMLTGVNFVQGADTMFLAHPKVPIQRLRRLDHADWSMEPAPFVTQPFDEIGFRPTCNAALSVITVGSGRTLTADNATFLASDVGREVWAGAGIAKITQVNSSVSAVVEVLIPFKDYALLAGQWRITGSPQTTCTPSAKDPVGTSITLTLPSASTSTSSESAKTIVGASYSTTTVESPPGSGTFVTTSIITVTLPNHGYQTGNTIVIAGFTPTGFNGTYTITVLNANAFTYSVPGDPGTASALGTAARVVTSSGAGGWRTDDVGKYVRINRGLVKITAVSSASSATGTILAALDATVTAPANAWTLEAPVWNEVDGYPAAVTMSEQRLIAAGSPGYPQTVWMSRTGEYLNFELGTKDDDAMSFTISSEQINPIVHLANIKSLIALTYGGEFTISGGVDKPITPTNIQVKSQSVYGCSAARPCRIGNELYFMQRAGRKLRAMAYKFDSDAYGSPDLSVLAEHATENGIVDMCYQQEPDSVLWLVRSDGVLATVSVDRDQDVVGWARQTTAGTYESVASIPVASGDELWAVVRRTVGGNTVRYIERFDKAIGTDAAITGTSAAGAKVWSGLSHLEGCEVDVVADGAVMQRQTVAGGQITLSRPAKAVQIGLPFETTIETLTPEVADGTGSAQGNSMRISEVTLRFVETTGVEVDGQVIAFRNLGKAQLDRPAPLFTGDHRIETLGWERGKATLTIKQKQPLPFHLLAVIKKFTVND